MESIKRFFVPTSYQRLDRPGSATSGAGFDNPYNEPEPLAACRVGDLGRLEREIKKDSSIVHRDYRCGKTGDTVSLLYIAVVERHVELTRLLIEKGADVNYTLKKNGRATVLAFAAEKGVIEIVRLLIDNGAKVNQASKKGSTPLFWAAWEGHTEIVKFLLANDADPEKEVKLLSMGRFSISYSPLKAAQVISENKEAAEMIETALQLKERKISSSRLNSHHYSLANMLLMVPFDRDLRVDLRVRSFLLDKIKNQAPRFFLRLRQPGYFINCPESLVMHASKFSAIFSSRHMVATKAG